MTGYGPRPFPSFLTVGYEIQSQSNNLMVSVVNLQAMTTENSLLPTRISAEITALQ